MEAPAIALRRGLGWRSLLVLGIANILGAGVYVMTGTAAAQYAGPAVVVSFVLAGLACMLVGLCYAELAACMPESGSSYTYCRRTLGLGPAWALGWLLFLEFSAGAALLAVGFSGYLGSLIGDLGLHLPVALATPLVRAHGVGGHTTLELGASVNLVAGLAALAAGAVMAWGISRSSLANAVLVAIKIAVLVGFVVVGAGAVDAAHWTPFVPDNEGGFAYGWQGVVRAASLLFFAFLGFETVSTAAAETADPQRDVPRGILGSLGVCTLLYVLVAVVLTGLVPFRELGVPDPIALAVDRIGMPGFAVLIKLGALAGLASVLLANAFGHSRVCYAMARDGLLPGLFTVIDPRRGSLWQANLALAAVAAVAAALLPVAVIADIVSFGVAFMFSTVAIALMRLRGQGAPPADGFRVPFGGPVVRGLWLGAVPVLAIVCSVSMVLPVALDILGQLRRGDWLPAALLGGYCALGAVLYFGYGRRRALARDAAGPPPPVPPPASTGTAA